MYRDTHLKEYLLGQLDEEARQRLEDRLLNDDTLFERVSALDEELVAALLDGDLPSSEAASLRSRLLASSQGRRHLALSMALAEKAQRFTPSQIDPARGAPETEPSGDVAQLPSWWRRVLDAFKIQWWLPAALAAGLTALLIGLPAHRHKDQLRSETQILTEEIATLRSSLPSLPAMKMGFELSPIVRSDSKIPDLSTPSEVLFLEFWLESPFSQGRFKAVVKIEDQVLFESAEISPRSRGWGHSIPIELAVADLAPGRLSIELLKSEGESWETVALYALEIPHPRENL